MDFELKIHKKQRTMYIPKELLNALGTEVTATPDRSSVFLYPKGLSTKDAIRSLEAIKEDLEHKVELQERGLVEGIKD